MSLPGETILLIIQTRMELKQYGNIDKGGMRIVMVRNADMSFPEERPYFMIYQYANDKGRACKRRYEGMRTEKWRREWNSIARNTLHCA